MFKWDKEKRRYRDDTGALIANALVRAWVESMCEALAVVFIARADRLLEDNTVENLQAWMHQTTLDLTGLHYALMMIAFGGQAEMDAEKWKAAEEAIAFQMGFFQNFQLQVATGAVEMHGHFPIRTSLYALAGYSSYEEGARIREADAGMTEEQRNTTSGRPCIDCQEAAALGWVAIGTLPAIGDSVCISRCRCYFIFR